MRYTIYFLLLITTLSGCRSHSSEWRSMDLAESVMEQFPDSALSILDSIDKYKLAGGQENARYALLMSMALDKNYVDTTTFDVLQPAIDYYLDRRKGSANDKIRTHYYRGRIYQNQGDDSRAMTSFIRAIETDGISDSLTLARAHVAMSVLMHNVFDTKGITFHALSAANLYKNLNLIDLQVNCYIQALEGGILSNNKTLSDSILSICESIDNQILTDSESLKLYKLSYALKFDSLKNIECQINNILKFEHIPNWVLVDIARGYLILGKPDLAKNIINTINPTENILKSENYHIVKSEILEANGQYKDALSSFKEFYEIEGNRNLRGATYDLSFIKEQHFKEIETIKRNKRTDVIVLIILISMLILLIIVLLLHYRHTLNKSKISIIEKDNEQLKTKQILILKTNENLELERRNAELERDKHMLMNRNLKEEAKRLDIEKRNAELERDRQILISDNKNMQIQQMEEEIEGLKQVLQQKENITKPMEKAVKERIVMLNSLIASVISDNNKYATAYETWKNKILSDHKTFMDSTRLAFKASHPTLIKYLEEHGLTEAEINYACLYALGLNGKEVGKYIHSQRHYHISSDIRQKLGLDINNTNLGIYIRRLMQQE